MSHPTRRRRIRALLAGSVLLLVASLGPALLAGLHNNRGSLELNRALLAPNPASDTRLTHFNDAGAAFQRALVVHPRAARPYYNLALIYAFWGDEVAAERALSQAARYAPGDFLVHFLHGRTLIGLGREGEACEAWQPIAGSFPFIDGIEEMEQENLDHARVAAECAVARAPDFAGGYRVLGNILTAQGHVTTALTVYQEGVRREGASPLLYEKLADLLDRRFDREDEAVATLEAALDLWPTDGRVRMRLARIHAERGDCGEVVEALAPLLRRTAEARNVDRANALAGACYLDAGRPYEALPYLELAATAPDTALRNLLRLAEAYRAVGRPAAARALYEQVLARDPDHRRARDALAELTP